MIDAKMLATFPTDQTLEVWGVWIPRRGDNVIFPLEVVANYATVLTAELFQKNYDESGNGTSASASTAFDETVGRQSITKLGAKELLRFRLTLARGVSASDDCGLVLFRFLQPVWFETVKV